MSRPNPESLGLVDKLVLGAAYTYHAMAVRESALYTLHTGKAMAEKDIVKREWRFKLRNNAHKRMTKWMGLR